jgi:predicted RNA-binding Zn ribbon-like protein
MARDSSPPKYLLVGGRLCLDFVNTTRDRQGEPEERITDYTELVGWSWRAGVLNAEEAARLKRMARRSPTEALAVLERSIALREAMHQVFLGAATNRRVRPESLELLNDELGRAMARSQVVIADGGFAWVWAEGGRALDSMLWPIARSAADLLTGGDLTTVRQCGGRACGWLFLDTSRNRTRRWCDMRVCGNRAKARRHHERVRAAGAA